MSVTIFAETTAPLIDIVLRASMTLSTDNDECNTDIEDTSTNAFQLLKQQHMIKVKSKFEIIVSFIQAHECVD